jgi:hypothetical protein
MPDLTPDFSLDELLSLLEQVGEGQRLESHHSTTELMDMTGASQYKITKLLKLAAKRGRLDISQDWRTSVLGPRNRINVYRFLEAKEDAVNP